MCTINAEPGEAIVCDVALPTVRGAIAADARCVVREESVPGEGTRLRLVDGDQEAFGHCVSTAVAEVNR